MRDYELRGVLLKAEIIDSLDLGLGHSRLLTSLHLADLRKLQKKVDLLIKHLGLEVDYGPRLQKRDDV